MIVRFREGPLKGQYQEHKGGDLLVEVPTYEKVEYGTFDPFASPFKRKRGRYIRSNIVTKRGIPVYQWMGFEGDVISR